MQALAVLASALLVCSGACSAQSPKASAKLPPAAQHPVIVGGANSADFPSRFGALCNVIGNGEEADANSEYYFAFEPILYGAAGVNASDSPSEVQRKMGRLFVNDVSRLYCRNINYEGGSLLRYAAYMRFDAFIEAVAVQWKVPAVALNQIDPNDGGTVLDFIDDEEVGETSGAIRQQEDRYRIKLRQAGAKNRVEIDGIECRQEGGFKPDARCGK